MHVPQFCFSCCPLASGAESSLPAFLPSSRRAWRGSLLMCKNRLLFLYPGKLPGFVPCGNYQHVFPRWPQSLQNSSQVWKQDKATCVLVFSRTCEHRVLFQSCVCNLYIPTCISPPQLFQFTKNFSVSSCTYSSSDVLSLLSTCTLSIEKWCWEWAHMVSHSTKTQHLWSECTDLEPSKRPYRQMADPRCRGVLYLIRRSCISSLCFWVWKHRVIKYKLIYIFTAGTDCQANGGKKNLPQQFRLTSSRFFLFFFFCRSRVLNCFSAAGAPSPS